MSVDVKSRAYLKALFETADTPTEVHFGLLIDAVSLYPEDATSDQNEINVDIVNEKIVDAGITLDGVHLKDSNVTAVDGAFTTVTASTSVATPTVTTNTITSSGATITAAKKIQTTLGTLSALSGDSASNRYVKAGTLSAATTATVTTTIPIAKKVYFIDFSIKSSLGGTTYYPSGWNDYFHVTWSQGVTYWEISVTDRYAGPGENLATTNAYTYVATIEP